MSPNAKEVTYLSKHRNRLLTPECAAALDAMKHEIAAELGLFIGQPQNAVSGSAVDSEFADEFSSIASYRTWADVSSREAGSVGGRMTANLVALAQHSLLGKT